jgi:hypothetical protein
MRFNQDEFADVRAISALFVVAQLPTRRFVHVLRCGLKLSQMIAIRTDAGYRERR